jgi:membrane-associated PAP2 superfamily phosphatase
LPRLATRWLTGAVAIGFFLGATQQLRGAHFMSHTLWTGWICWMVGWLSDPLFSRPESRALA